MQIDRASADLAIMQQNYRNQLAAMAEERDDLTQRLADVQRQVRTNRCSLCAHTYDCFREAG